jgi:hypothetical protein
MTTHRSSKQAAEIYILKTSNTRHFGLRLFEAGKLQSKLSCRFKRYKQNTFQLFIFFGDALFVNF